MHSQADLNVYILEASNIVGIFFLLFLQHTALRHAYSYTSIKCYKNIL